jgi:Ni/Co efflux regulator RcnB
MKKLALVSIAALAVALPGLANAQPGPNAGHSWQQPGRHMVVRQDGRRHHRRFGHIPRIQRGFILPHFWWGPQFHVQNWQMYGFPRPTAGHRWVRYYDDALLVDRRGTVRDGRYGMDWDRYGDRWGEDERGIPVYVGDGDYHPGERDYDWVEANPPRGDGDWDYAEYGRDSYRGGHGPAPQGACGPRQGPCGYVQPAPAYGYGGTGYGYGQGYGCCGTVTITETTVTTGAVTMETYEEVIEEEVVQSGRQRRVVRRAAPPPPPRRRPIRGERG